MRNLAILSASALFLFAAGCGSKDEDCTNGADDDGDGAADCSDSECAADPTCDEGDDEDCGNGDDDDGDGDVDCDDSDCDGDDECEEVPTTETDCEDQVDNDEDGLTDCQDDDCGCEVVRWLESGTATVSDSYSGSGVWSYDTVDYFGTGADERGICKIDFDLNSVGGPEEFDAECPDCEFAFMVEISNSAVSEGDCSNVTDFTDGSADGATYGYGFTRAYSYGSYDFTDIMMYYSGTYAAWVPVADEATLTGDSYQYDWAVTYFYY